MKLDQMIPFGRAYFQSTQKVDLIIPYWQLMFIGEQFFNDWT